MLAFENEGDLGSLFPRSLGKNLDPVTNEFREKLGRAESEKRQVEEKLEAATASWKRERRQLTDQIERFRRALARTSNDVTDTDGIQRRLYETIRYSQQLELKSRKRVLEIESGRKLRSEQVRWRKTQRGLEGEIERLRKELTAAPSDQPSLIQRFFGPGR